jgi:putative ABC transport system substrate-binding protein
VIPRFLPFTLALSLAGGLGVAGDVSRAAELAEKIVRLGFVSPVSYSIDARSIDGFWQRLRELGWVEGENLRIEARLAQGDAAALPDVVAELVRVPVDLIVAAGVGPIQAAFSTALLPSTPP